MHRRTPSRAHAQRGALAAVSELQNEYQCFWIQLEIRSRTLGENCISVHGCPGSDGCVHTHIRWSMSGIVSTVKSAFPASEVSDDRPEVRRGVKIAVASAVDGQDWF